MWRSGPTRIGGTTTIGAPPVGGTRTWTGRGLCRWDIIPGASSDQQVRCTYDFGHGGGHSWERVVRRRPVYTAFVHETTLTGESNPKRD